MTGRDIFNEIQDAKDKVAELDKAVDVLKENFQHYDPPLKLMRDQRVKAGNELARLLDKKWESPETTEAPAPNEDIFS